MFSFEGYIGRMEMWLVYVSGNLAMVLIPSPIQLLTVRRRCNFVHIDYPIPASPLTSVNWALVAGYCAIEVLVLWIVVAAMVRWLHDRNRSGKWLGLFVLGLVAVSGLFFENCHIAGQSTLLDFIEDGAFVVVTAMGAWIMWEILFFPSSRFPALFDANAAFRSENPD